MEKSHDIRLAIAKIAASLDLPPEEKARRERIAHASYYTNDIRRFVGM